MIVRTGFLIRPLNNEQTTTITLHVIVRTGFLIRPLNNQQTTTITLHVIVRTRVLIRPLNNQQTTTITLHVIVRTRVFNPAVKQPTDKNITCGREDRVFNAAFSRESSNRQQQQHYMWSKDRVLIWTSAVKQATKNNNITCDRKDRVFNPAFRR